MTSQNDLSRGETSLVHANNPAMVPQDAYSTAPLWLDGQEEDGVSFTDVLHSLRRRWLPGVLVGLVVATLVAALLYVLIPVKSEAIALVRVKMSNTDVLQNRFSATGNTLTYKVYKETQSALLKSPYVLRNALIPPEMKGLALLDNAPDDNPVAMLKDELSVSYPGDSELMRVSMKGKNGTELKAVVNAVVEAYLQENKNMERGEDNTRLILLRGKYRENITAIKDLTSEIERLGAEIGTSDSQMARLNQRIQESELRGIENARQRALAEMDDAERRLTIARAASQSQLAQHSPLDIEDELETDREYYESKRTMSEYQRLLGMYASVGRGPNPAVDEIKLQIESLNQMMASRRRELVPRVKRRLDKEAYGDENEGASTLRGLTIEYQIAQSRFQNLDAGYATQIKELQELTGFSAELVTKRSSLTNLQNATNEINGEISRLELNVQKEPRVKLVQSADIPDNNSAQLKLIEIIAAWMGTFGLCVAAAVALDYLSKRLNTTKDIQDSGLALIGTLPSFRGGWLGSPSESDIANSVDTIRAAIRLGRKGRKIGSVVVTSAVGGEGKTSLASQLAVSMARGGKRTLLIDGDIRNPQQHAVFGLPADRGLCDVLRGEAQLEEVVQATPAENLWILPAGRCDMASYHALPGVTTSVALERLTAQFDFVVIDSGPVLTGPEALIFGQYVDGAVLSTRRDTSRIEKIRDANNRLRSVDIHVIGSVMNGVSTISRNNLPAIAAS